MTAFTYAAPSRVSSLQRLALIVGVVGLGLCAVGFSASREQFFRAWLIAFLFWWGVSLGSLAWMMVHHLSGGQWGVVTRRVFEASSRVLPFMALAFLPVAFGVRELYPWARPELVANDEILQHRAPYLNVSFFYLRAVLYFVLWSGLAYLISGWSRQQDSAPGDEGLAIRMQRLSGGGLLLYGITLFFASVDWLMSLDPHWYSTIYGILMLGGQGLASMAFTLTVMVLLVAHGATGRRVPRKPPARPGQADAGLRHVVGVLPVLAVPDHLVGQPARGDRVLPDRGSRARGST